MVAFRRDATGTRSELQRANDTVTSLRASLTETQADLDQAREERTQVTQRLAAVEVQLRQRTDVHHFALFGSLRISNQLMCNCVVLAAGCD